MKNFPMFDPCYNDVGWASKKKGGRSEPGWWVHRNPQGWDVFVDRTPVLAEKNWYGYVVNVEAYIASGGSKETVEAFENRRPLCDRPEQVAARAVALGLVHVP
jgi:hypothetical protein